MNRRRNALISLLVLLACAVSIVSVQALPTCEKYVKNFVEQRVPNKVSKKTLAAWALWGKSHPDFKPKPRPRYKLTRKEVVTKVDFACETPPAPPVSGGEVPPPVTIAVENPPKEVPYLLPELPDVVEIATAGAPPLAFIPPYTTGVTPPMMTAVPEPSGLVLASTGMALMAAMAMYTRHRRQGELPSL